MSCKIVGRQRAAGLRPIAWNEAPPPVAGEDDGLPLYFRAPPPGREPAGEDAGLQQALRELEQDAQRRAQEAYERGLREGRAAAEEEARAAWQTKLEQLARAIEGLATLRSRIRKEAEGDLIKLSLAIARRILHREVSVDPHALAGVVKACTERLDRQEVHRVRVHPDFAAGVGEWLERWKAGVQVDADPAVGRGGLVFETARGAVDAGVETQLDEIERGFTELLPKEARR
jgi:flagellar assembly protein FliH